MASIASQEIPVSVENEEERLRELFWNRAALKKQFAQLGRENHKLKDLLHQREGATRRVQQQLEDLEVALADPRQAANVIVFYQLRGVWKLVCDKLAGMATELTAHQREREQKKITRRFEQTRKLSIETLTTNIVKVKKRADELAENLEAIQKNHDQLRGFWNYFKRRKLQAEAEPVRVSLGNVNDQLEQLRQARKAKEAEKPPKLKNMSLNGERKINIALIAIAQELYLHFSERGISAKAREASVRNVVDAKYGDIDHCRALNSHIEKRIHRLESGHELVANVRNRTKFLEQQATYRNESDFVPAASSFGEIPLIKVVGDEPEADGSVVVNILADEYWEIYSVLRSG